MCGATDAPHVSHGYCKNCYPKTKRGKKVRRDSIKKHWKKIKARAKEYNERPEVKEKIEQKRNWRYFGGNREKALERDNYQCSICGLTREENRKRHNRDLYVSHIKKGNNNLDNLITMCPICHFDGMVKKQFHREIGNRDQKTSSEG